MDEYNIREKHIKLTTLKMDYNILKSSKIDEFDHRRFRVEMII